MAFDRVLKRTPVLTDAALLPLRLATGLLLAFGHGFMKAPPSGGFVEMVGGMGFPFPTFFAWCSAAAEVGGGFLLAAGLATRYASFFVLLNMIVVVFVSEGGAILGGAELPFFYLVSSFLFLLIGGGRFSLDALFVSGRA